MTTRRRNKRDNETNIRIYGKPATMFKEEWDMREQNYDSPPATMSQLACDLIAEAIRARLERR